MLVSPARAVLYAVLDRSPVVRPSHLMAGLTLWEYADITARAIFTTQIGDPIADAIDAALRAGGHMTRNQIMDLFNRNVPSDRLAAALSLLEAQRRARRFTQETGGRPAECWEAI